MSQTVFCLVTLLLATGALAQQPPPRDTPARDTPPPAAGTAVIRGRVLVAGALRQDSGQADRPLSRVEVRAFCAPLKVNKAVLTDGNGRYEIADLPAGRYTVSFSRANYVRASYGQRRPLGPGAPIDVANGQIVTRVDAALQRDRRHHRPDPGRVRRSDDRCAGRADAVHVHQRRAPHAAVGRRRHDQRSRRVPDPRALARAVFRLGLVQELPVRRQERPGGVRADLLPRHGKRRRGAAADDRGRPDHSRHQHGAAAGRRGPRQRRGARRRRAAAGRRLREHRGAFLQRHVRGELPGGARRHVRHQRRAARRLHAARLAARVAGGRGHRRCRRLQCRRQGRPDRRRETVDAARPCRLRGRRREAARSRGRAPEHRPRQTGRCRCRASTRRKTTGRSRSRRPPGTS